jgi:CBS domain containing-hemolysin-like protein
LSIVFILTFILSFIFSAISSLASNINVFILVILLLIIILIGIVFDMIGVAVLSCDEATFHAKASNKIKGSKECVKLIKMANQTSSICCDVIGDICGIISGSVAASLVLMLMKNSVWCSVFVTAILSSLTVGGKAIGKKIAIRNCENIIFFVGKILNKLKI